MIPEFGLTVIDATLPVEVQQAQVRQIVQTHLERARRLEGATMRQTYGKQLPGMKLSDLAGKLDRRRGNGRRRTHDADQHAEAVARGTRPRGARYGHDAIAAWPAKVFAAQRKETISAA